MGLSFLEHAFVINLDSRPDRWKKMQSQFAAMGISGVQRFPAVSFSRLDNNPPPMQFRARSWALSIRGRKNIAKFEHKVSAAWACLCSHLAVIEQARQEGRPWVLVMEDDCDFEPYLRPVLQRVEAQLEDRDWDIIYLGGKCKKKGLKQRIAPNLFAVNRIVQTHAYILRSNMYERVLREAPVSGMPIDVYYSEVLLPTVKAVLVDPIVAYQRLDEMSDIRHSLRPARFKMRNILATFRRWVARVKYGR